MKLIVGRYVGAKLEQHERDCDSAEAAVAELDRLDGRAVSELVAHGAAGADMIIGGGPSGYVVTIFDDARGEGHLLCRTGTDTGREVMVVSGGQSAPWDADLVVPPDLAAQALRGFFATGAPDPALTWRRDG